jgi:uncharacterized protein (TIGR03435 family)
MIRAIGVACLTAFTSYGAFGQSTPSVRTFEVASVRPHEGPLRTMGVLTTGQRLNGAETVRGLIMYAYNMKNYQVSGPTPPSPVGDTFYDVVAKAEGDAAPTKEEFRQMLQSLLADRFKLKIHRENREMPVYALVLGKNGPKFKDSDPDASFHGNLHVSGRNYEVTLTSASMDDVVRNVANSFPDRPVIDRTGLTGHYDVKMTYTPDVRSNRTTDPDPNDISIFTGGLILSWNWIRAVDDQHVEGDLTWIEFQSELLLNGCYQVRSRFVGAN